MKQHTPEQTAAFNWWNSHCPAEQIELRNKYLPSDALIDMVIDKIEIIWNKWKEAVTPSPSSAVESGLFTITANLDDHKGYAGEPVKIVARHENDYFTVQNEAGKQWHCGEEELTPSPSLGIEPGSDILEGILDEQERELNEQDEQDALDELKPPPPQ